MWFLGCRTRAKVSSSGRTIECSHGTEEEGVILQHCSLLFFIFAVLVFELRAYTLSHSTLFFKIGSHQLFAQAGFEL
jgi:hypothetical protein